MENLRELIRDIDKHMRAEWYAGRLPAESWPKSLSDRLAAAVSALAATPAAAPVVLPEPDDSEFEQQLPIQPIGVMGGGEARKVLWNCTFMPEAGTSFYTEQQVRALLATGGQAQAVATLTEEALAEKIRSHGGYGGLAAVLMPFITQHAAPQAQADALDAARLDWLDAQVKHHPVHNGYTWQEGGYEENRGLVCAIQKPKQKQTARQAIDAAIAAAKAKA